MITLEQRSQRGGDVSRFAHPAGCQQGAATQDRATVMIRKMQHALPGQALGHDEIRPREMDLPGKQQCLGRFLELAEQAVGDCQRLAVLTCLQERPSLSEEPGGLIRCEGRNLGIFRHALLPKDKKEIVR